MSGAQIGGIIGGVVGSFFGMPQVGCDLGAAIGGYADPVRTYGPRISDSAAQTSSVGGVIPFGFGTFTTAGNLIWRDQLKEHAKTQRQGKGGGAKTTTYTYTRSYAIGICRGPIYGIKWIKRNGKKVYTTDPAATQEEKQASAKFAAKLSIYLGTETQLPDATITAVDGMGNVNAHRGLAYVVVEHDDLTDLGGAVPQYEFCVQATPPEAYLTTEAYPQLVMSAAVARPLFLGAATRPLLIEHEQPSEDQFHLSPLYLFARTNEAYWQSQQGPSSATFQPLFFGASTKQTYRAHDQPHEDNFSVTPLLIGASTRHALQTHIQPQEDNLTLTPLFIGASTT